MPQKMGPYLPLLALGLFLFVRTANAYIDPGTGSFVLQTLLGILFGCAYAMKIYWRHVVEFFRSIGARKSRDEKSGSRKE